MGPKYEFTDETIMTMGSLLHRIRRLSDGQLGGFIEKEENLSQEGNCWVGDVACVYSNAKVYGNAQIYGCAHVYDNAKVYGSAEICSDAQIFECAEVYDNAQVYGSAQVYGDAHIYDKAQVYNNAKVYGFANVYNNAQIYNNALIYECAEIYQSAKVYGNAEVYRSAKVYGKAKVWDYAKVYGLANVRGNAKIYDNAEVYFYATVDDNAQIYDNAKVYGFAIVYDNAIIYNKANVSGNASVHGDAKVSDDKYNEKLEGDNKFIKAVEKPLQDFIYKVNDSQKLEVQTEYESLDEFFSEPAGDDLELDTLIICTVDTKEPIIKLQKVDNNGNINFKFIVEITNSKGEEFIIRSFIESQEQLDKLIKQTVEALTIYSQFNIYADELEEIIG